MKKTIKLPVLEKAGIGKRFKVFIEIARHPDGMTISDITKSFSGPDQSTKHLKLVKQGIGHHVKTLKESGYITTKLENRNGHVAKVCRSTKTGVGTVHEEMCRLCQMLKEIYNEA